MKKLFSFLLTIAILAVSAAALAETPTVAVVLAGTQGDRSFYDSSVEGAKQLNADFGTQYTVIECNNNNYEASLYEAADSYEVVCAVGWQFWDALAAENGILEDYPDVRFLFIDNGLESGTDNLMSIVYTQNEGSFLTGFIAAKLSATGKIGVVGGEDSQTINDFIVGYEQGAKYANPDITVLRQYSNTYDDPAKGKECALALYDMGCDIIYQVASKTGEGVFEAARETGNYAIGVDGDQKYIDPDVILCSMVKKVGKSIYDVVADPDAFFRGGQIWTAGMATGYIDVVYGTEDMTQQVSDELKAEVEELKQRIISGEIVVDTTF